MIQEQGSAVLKHHFTLPTLGSLSAKKDIQKGYLKFLQPYHSEN